jgi:pimeloyl-ACP methyl ester carboxylesterase
VITNNSPPISRVGPGHPGGVGPPPLGVTVVLVTQPYRVEGDYDVADEASLDRAWAAIWPCPAELLATGRPTLVVQGGRDPFGRPDQFPPLPPNIELAEIPLANHMFATEGSGGAETLPQLTGAVIAWLDPRLGAITRGH